MESTNAGSRSAICLKYNAKMTEYLELYLRDNYGEVTMDKKLKKRVADIVITAAIIIAAAILGAFTGEAVLDNII